MKVSAETVRENDLEQQILNDTMELQDAADCKEPGASEIQEWALALESDLDQGWASLPFPSPDGIRQIQTSSSILFFSNPPIRLCSSGAPYVWFQAFCRLRE